MLSRQRENPVKQGLDSCGEILDKNVIHKDKIVLPEWFVSKDQAAFIEHRDFFKEKIRRQRSG